MVAGQLRARGIRDERVLQAMASVPREAFVPDAERGAAYYDEALPIGEGQTISQPYMVARMTELLDVQPGDRILEIGTGSGYQAAILAWLGARVTTFERQAALIPKARAAHRCPGTRRGRRDPTRGRQPRRPGRRALGRDHRHRGRAAIPVELRDQLADGGRLVIPVGPRDRQILTVVTRHGDEWTEQPDGACVFVPLIGEGGFDG